MRENKYFRRFILLIWGAIPISSFCVEVWPIPGVALVSPSKEIASFPTSDKGTVFFDLGALGTQRRSIYGIGLGLIASCYRNEMVGAQMAFMGCESKNAYGVQVGLFNGAEAGYGLQTGFVNGAGNGVGVQTGFLNIYDDESFRLQIGAVNTHKFMFLKGGSIKPGGWGIQTSILNASSKGKHLQLGLFNLAHSSDVLQVGFYNSLDEKSRGLQVGLINIHGEPEQAMPLVGWCW